MHAPPQGSQTRGRISQAELIANLEMEQGLLNLFFIDLARYIGNKDLQSHKKEYLNARLDFLRDILKASELLLDKARIDQLWDIMIGDNSETSNADTTQQVLLFFCCVLSQF